MNRRLHLYRFVLLLFMLVETIPFAAGYDFEMNGIYYNIINSDKVSVTYRNLNGNSYSGDIIIPSTVTNNGTTYSVTSIGDNAFLYCYDLTCITLPNSLTNIGNVAFSECESLTTITIPNSVTNIGSGAFSWCSSLTSINLPNTLTNIGDYAFSQCSRLTSITIPNSVITIDDGTFIGCTSLKSVTIPNSITAIGERVFSNCSRLTNITLPNSLTSIGDYAFSYCSSLTSLTLPNSLTFIGNEAFNNCSSLTTITIPNSVTSIGYKVFSNCSRLTNITLPNSLTSIGDYAFYECSSLTSLTLPNSLTFIGNEAFNKCSSLTTITIPNSVTSIGYKVFSNCSRLTNITLPNSLTSIGDHAFSYCSRLTSLTLPNSLTSIGDEAFNSCSSLTTITIPNSVSSIGDGAFYECTRLTTLTLPNSLTSIGDFAFSYCRSLTSITLPNSVITISEGAFYECISLTTITLPNSLTSIGDHAFSYCSKLNTITLPNSLTSIGDYAFSYCSKLNTVTLPNSVATIGYGTFSYCSSLTSITLPNSLTSIGDYAFYECSSLTTLTLPNALTSIGDYAFSHCSSLTTLTLPNSVASIGNYAFSHSPNLINVICWALEPPSLGDGCFYGVSKDMIVFVPLGAIGNYQDAPKWNKFTILPIDSGHKLSVFLPENVNVQDYVNMRLEVKNTESEKSQYYTLTDKPSYTFNVEPNLIFSVKLTNQYGDLFGCIEHVEICEENTVVTFPSLLKPHDVTLTINIPNGQDVTSGCKVLWMDDRGELLLQGHKIKGLPAGRKLSYQVTLSQDLATAYTMPTTCTYTVKDDNNSITCQLTAISQMHMSGKVNDATSNQPLNSATISAVQSFGGNNTRTLTVRTDNQGQYSLDGSLVPTTLTVSAYGYISQTMNCDLQMSGSDITLPDVALSPITGTVVNVNLTYTPAHAQGVQPNPQDWYNDYDNVDYEVFNKTKNRVIDDCHVQFPQIILTEGVDNGDVLELTATSRKYAFKPVMTTVTIANQKATAKFNIVERGKIVAKFKKNSNQAVVGTLYDSQGEFVNSYNYTADSLVINDLTDGNYTFVTMGQSEFFNTIYDLSQFSQAGLQANVDYAQNDVYVIDGLITDAIINDVPFFDETKFYYSGERTSFTVNKSNITVGNYLTFRAQLDFKEQFAEKVKNVRLIVDLPQSCQFYENSVMVGSNISNYTVNGNQITIPLANHKDIIRFCAIPTVQGDFAPSAFVQFNLNGKTITQPIGNASYIVKGLSINVPSIVDKTAIPISGTAFGACNIDIYDNDVFIGQTTSLANGNWATTCELHGPYNLSKHLIHAKMTNPTGIVLNTESMVCTYDRYNIKPRTVTMSFYNGWMNKTISAVFDFENGTTFPSSYSFYTATNFTFVADLTNNDPTVVSGVTLYIHTDKNEIHELAATYDKKLDRWVAMSRFGENNLPVNVSISIHSSESTYADRGQFNLLANRIDEKKEETTQTLNDIDDLEEAANAVDQQIAADEDAFASLENQINAATDNDEMNQLLVQWLTQAGLESSIEDFIVEIPEMVDEGYIQTLISKGQELLDSSDDIDYTTAIDELLTQVDEALKDDDDSFDYMASLQSALSDSITVDTENGTATLFRTTLDKYGDIPFEATDTVRMEMTDSSAVYIYVSAEDEVIIVDSVNNSVWYINDRIAVQEVAKSHLRKAKGDFVAAMNNARQQLSWLGNTVLAFVKEMISDQESVRAEQQALKEALESQQAVLLGQSAGMQIRINEIEKELQALTAPDVITMEEYFGIVDRDELVNKLKLEREKVLEKMKANKVNINKLTKSLSKCSAKILAVAAVLGQLQDLYEVGQGIFTTISYVSTAIQDHHHWYSLIDNILPCDADFDNAVTLKTNCQSDWSDIAWKKGYYPAFTITALTTVVNGYMMTNRAAKIVARVLIAAITDFLNNTAKAMFENARRASSSWYPMRYAEYRSLKCNIDQDPDDENEPDKPEDPDDSDKKNPPLPPTTPLHDPSGFVYEGVPSNRLQGVTATCYYKETVEDMYGDEHENVVLWDAEQYGQENPLLTDENGFYRWDVPIGMWQVKYDKEGYETTYSDWLPVPPPQLDVNIGMVQMRQPEVIKARAYPKAVELEFDKYMMPETLTNENITVSVNGTLVSGSIELLNAEVDDPNAITSIRRAPGTGLTLASRVRFNADKPFNADKVTLHVNYKVESYAGLMMNEDYEAVLDVELELQSIEADSTVNVVYGDSRELTVTVLPAAASKGKTLTVRSFAPMIATTDAESFTLDKNGQAVITVHGDLPGMTSLIYNIDGYDLTAATLVNVKMLSEMTVAKPTASIASGSEVERGTEVYLRCATEGATIYYTLDGSCPCDNTDARMVYDGTPIIINSNITIKAMAIADGMYDSDVATFTYRVSGGMRGDVNLDGSVNIADINLLIDYILRDKINNEMLQRGDVNGDNTINIADINVVIQIILGGPGAKMPVSTTDLLHLNDLNLRPGETGLLHVTVDNAVRYSALQCDIVLPDGLTLVDVAATGAAIVKSGMVNDATSRVLTYSMSQLPFINDSHPVLTLTVRADAALSDMSDITLTGIVLADATGVAWYANDCAARVNNASGINDLNATASRIWTEGRTLCLSGHHDSSARIISVNGITYNLDVNSGIVRRELDPGIYIVVIDGMSHKVVIR